MVVSGKIQACKYVIQACQRHINDLKQSKKASFPYRFDVDEANRWFELYGLLRLWKSKWAGQPFKLEPWQKFIVGSLFGWLHKKTGLRRFKKAYIEMARKNAKTTLMAGIAVGMMCIDGENGAQVYAGATKEEQARIVVNDTARIIEASGDVYIDPETSQKNFRIYDLNGVAKRIVYFDSNSFMAPVGRDSKSLDGLDISCGIIDEYHAHKSDELKAVIESAMGARKQPLLLMITTAGFDKESPCFAYRRMITELLDGIKTDENTFGIIYTLDEGDDWQDPKTWIKANPNLGVSVDPDFLKSELVDALNQPSKQTSFLTKNLNLWVDAPTVWIPDEQFKACIDYRDLSELSGDCWIGLDLAATADICCAHLYFPAQKYFKPIFFCPKETAKKRERDDGVPYQQWAKDNWIKLTDGGGGKTTDYSYILSFITGLPESINVKTIAYDRWNSSQLVIELKQLGYRCEPYAQSMSNMSYPTKEFEKMVLANELTHDGNPCMSWMMRNVALITDGNDNIKIDKKKSAQKVDGPVAAVMALGQHIIDGAQPEEEYIWA